MLRPQAKVHLILEQGMAPHVIALHFTAAFHGGARRGIMQRVDSSPLAISTQMMVDKYQFNRFCSIRPCNMHTGSMRFQDNVPELVFSGISVLLDIGDHRQYSAPREEVDQWNGQDIPQAQDAAPSDATSFMQHPTRWTTRTSGSRPSTDVHQIEAPQGTNYQVHDPQGFRLTLAWQKDQRNALCATASSPNFQVTTWLLDSVRCTRLTESRQVLLQAEPINWIPHILHRWHDLLDPAFTVHLHVVYPHPIDSPQEVIAHVILVQRPNDLWRVALISRADHSGEPWRKSVTAAMMNSIVTPQDIAFIAGAWHAVNAEPVFQPFQIRHGSLILDPEQTFPVRNGFSFELKTFSHETPFPDGLSLLQTGFRRVQTQIKELMDAVDERLVACTDGTILPMELPAPSAISMTIPPMQEPPTALDPGQALMFHGAMQAFWQPLSVTRPAGTPPMVPVVTWYIDHVHMPHCFRSRIVWLGYDVPSWARIIRGEWTDVILPDEPITFHIVQPEVPEKPPFIATHIILAQQEINGFRSVLLSIYDSNSPTVLHSQYATMGPELILWSTLIGMANLDRDCQNPRVDCAAWVGNDPLLVNQPLPVLNGHSLTVAVHRHITPITGDIWNGEPAPIPANDQPDSSAPGKPRSKVPISIHASLPDPITEANTALNESDPQLLWFEQEAWLLKLTEDQPWEAQPLPDGLMLPTPTYGPLVFPQLSQHADQDDITLYIDGASNGTQAGWGIAMTEHTADGEILYSDVCMEWFASTHRKMHG